MIDPYEFALTALLRTWRCDDGCSVQTMKLVGGELAHCLTHDVYLHRLDTVDPPLWVMGAFDLFCWNGDRWGSSPNPEWTFTEPAATADGAMSLMSDLCYERRHGSGCFQF